VRRCQAHRLERNSGLGSRLARRRCAGSAGNRPRAGEHSDPVGLDRARDELIHCSPALRRSSIGDPDREVALARPLGQRRLAQQLQRRHTVGAGGAPQQHQQLKLGLVPRWLAADARPVEPDGLKVLIEPHPQQTDKPPARRRRAPRSPARTRPERYPERDEAKGGDHVALVRPAKQPARHRPRKVSLAWESTRLGATGRAPGARPRQAPRCDP
jgi:hypothetical protein